jgi:thioredoxin reductase (NADPH)
MDYDLIVVGQGMAGLTCAGDAARLGLRVAHFESEFCGGLVANVVELERFDEADGLSGMDHAMTLARDNMKVGVANRAARVHAVRVVHAVSGAEGGFEVDADDGTHRARAVVLATGARLAELSVPGEKEYEGRGVSHCADCDGPLFAGAEVVVVGAGDWALQEALLLARDCAAVHVVHAESRPSAGAEALARARAEPKIRWHTGLRVAAIAGNAQGMTGVRLVGAADATHAAGAAGPAGELAAAGLFPLAGLVPNGEIAPEAVQRDDSGHLQVGDTCETAVPSLWAIGQVRAGFGGWLSDAVADGRQVAQAIKNRLG